MVAYILQMLFAVLSLCSLALIIGMIVKNIRATKKQWRLLLLPILLMFMAIAYRFDWVENANNDISRFFKDFERLREYGFFCELKHADEFSWLWRVIAYVFSNINNLHWFPVFAVAVVYIIYFHILVEMTEKHSFSALDVLLCLMLQLSLMPLIMTATACRNTIAYAFFSMGVYTYYKKGLKNLRVYSWMLAGVLTHTTVMIGVIIFAVSFLIKRHRAVTVLLLLLGLLLGNVLVPAFASSSNAYIRYFVEKWELYIRVPNQFDIVKNNMIFPGLLLIFIAIEIWFIGRNPSPQKERVGYIVSNMAVTLGVYGVMAELFLRLCYPTSILMPVLIAELKSTAWQNSRKGLVIFLLFISSAFILFALTRAGWLWQLYWFFEP